MAKVVDINYEDLKNGKDLSQEIEEAYGPGGLGLLTVSNVPGVQEKRKKLLTLTKQFAEFPEEIKQKYVDEKSVYSFGWSHGKEGFRGKTDVMKGSYYANPEYDIPTQDQSLIEKYPENCSPNIWPKEDLPELENAFKDYGQLIVSVGYMIAQHCDKYVKSKLGDIYPDNKIYNSISQSKNTKSRILYYFPPSKDMESTSNDNNDIENDDSWCGLHLDHGTLTGLSNAMYFEGDNTDIDNTDSKAGLYIKTRTGEYVKAGFRRDQLAFQIGETAQIQSGGYLVATPHLVRGPSKKGISRAQFANFMQPAAQDQLDPPQNISPEQCGVKHFDQGGLTFAEFTKRKVSEYY